MVHSTIKKPLTKKNVKKLRNEDDEDFDRFNEDYSDAIETVSTFMGKSKLNQEKLLRARSSQARRPRRNLSVAKAA
jgi:hypothetical protein